MISRRRFLRGMFQGAAVTASLPLLDIFLDSRGQALADSPLNFAWTVSPAM